LAQSALDTPASLSITNVSIPQALLLLSKSSKVEIAFSDHFFKNKNKVTLDLRNQPMTLILNRLLANTGVGYRELDGQVVLFLLEKAEPHLFTLSGYVEDADTGERLIAAAVFCTALSRGTVTNEYGFFSLTLPEGVHCIEVSYLGYTLTKKELNFHANQFSLFSLLPALTLSEVIVMPRPLENVLLPYPDWDARLQPDNLKATPDLGGESDLLRVLHLLPGVQTGTDGIDGMHVRGGNADQNLVLLDGVPVYNPQHLLGLFSIFNTSSIRSVNVIKGGFPARYGGRLSSVVDVRTREGNQKKWSGEAGAGLISAQAAVEGPFDKGKGAILLSGRKTHSDFFLEQAGQKLLFNEEGLKTNYGFYDINAKVNYHFSEKDRLFVSFYKGDDVFKGILEKFEEPDSFGSYRYDSDTRLRWGNEITSLRWNHLFNDKLFSNTTLTYSHYDFSLGIQEVTEFLPNDPEEEPFKINFFLGYLSDIKDAGIKTDVEYSPNERHYLRFGAEGTWRRFQPGVGYYESENPQDSLTFQELFGNGFPGQKAFESVLYAEDEFLAGKHWRFNLGLRLSSFLTSDQLFFNPEPRLNVTRNLSKRWKFNASLDRTVQYVHLVATSSGISLPTDYWTPVRKLNPPQKSWQASAGAEGELPGKFTLGVEGYYKSMKNLIAFRDSFEFDPFEEPDPSQFFISGEGKSFGCELLLRREEGRTGGWLGYGYAQAWRRYDDRNLGHRYPFHYDRRHEVKLFLYYRIRKNWTASMNWYYGSPNPRLLYDAPLEDTPGKRNAIRSTPYHRLDLALGWSLKRPRFEHAIKLNVYNVYSRKNVAYYEEYYLDNDKYELRPVWLFPIMPGAHYEVKF
jgi:hypothetical protein